MNAACRNVVFRTDAHPSIGYGHFFRCLALAQAFLARGSTCTVASRTPGYLRDLAEGIEIIDDLPGGEADWSTPAFREAVDAANLLVTDLYSIDARWQANSPVPVLAITDPPFRDQACAFQVKPTTFGEDQTPRVMTAPTYSIIRPVFAERRKAPKNGDRLLIAFGAGHDAGFTLRIATALNAVCRNATVCGTFVIGKTDEATERRLRDAVDRLPSFDAVSDVTDMAALIDAHDWAIGSASGGALERACLGLAQVLIPIADNQENMAEGLTAHGAATMLSPDVTEKGLEQAIAATLQDHDSRRKLACAAFDLVDGQGASRIVNTVETTLGLHP